MEATQHKKFLAFHVPNGGVRTDVEAGILKAMGVMAGVYDIQLMFAPKKCSCGGCMCNIATGRSVFVELKMRTRVTLKGGPNKGKTVTRATKRSTDQEKFHERANALGFPCYMIESKDIPDAVAQMLTIIRTEGGFDW